jgi:putative redox protein
LLDLPLGSPTAYTLFAHCFTCGKDKFGGKTHRGAADVMRGLGVLRFDFTGLGGSQGDFANTNFSSM